MAVQSVMVSTSLDGSTCVSATDLLPANPQGPGGLSPECGPFSLGPGDHVMECRGIWADSLGPPRSRSSDLLISW